MLDKTQPFQEHIGTLVEGVKFVQDGKAYKANSEFIGLYADGKLTKSDDEPQAPEGEKDPLDEMDRASLITYALNTFDVKLKGNASTATLRQQIRELAE